MTSRPVGPVEAEASRPRFSAWTKPAEEVARAPRIPRRLARLEPLIALLAILLYAVVMGAFLGWVAEAIRLAF